MKEYPKINTIFKRDEQGRIILTQYSTPEIAYLAQNEWLFTEKIDGTNIRIIWDGQRVTFGGKTDNSQIPSSLINKLLDLFPPGKFIEWPEGQVCLYGEGFGARIQKGGGNYIPNGVDFILFDVWISGWWLEWKDVLDIGNRIGIKVVPEIGCGQLSKAIEMTRIGFNSAFGNFLAEGIVAKPIVDLWSRKGERIITKIKRKDFK